MPMSLTSPLHPIPIPIPLPSSTNSNSKPVGAVRAPHRLLLVRSSSGDGTPLRRPSAPTKDKEKEATPPMRPLAPSSDFTPAPTTSPTTSVFPSPSTPVVTVEFQRQKAKDLQEYFRQKKAEEQALKSKVFGFTQKNEISNGRWAMFGFAVGLLTEYATGSSFVDQMKLIISNLGIADLE